jgi:hypothetical protein
MVTAFWLVPVTEMRCPLSGYAGFGLFFEITTRYPWRSGLAIAFQVSWIAEPDTVPVSWAAGCVLLLSQVAADAGARRRIPAKTKAARRERVKHFMRNLAGVHPGYLEYRNSGPGCDIGRFLSYDYPIGPQGYFKILNSGVPASIRNHPTGHGKRVTAETAGSFR